MATDRKVSALTSIGNIADGDKIVGERVSGTTVLMTVTGVTKLAGIEDGATADQSAAEIKVAYESNADTNAYTDAEQSKLAAISGTNTGDQTTIVGITGTKAEFDTAVTDGNILYVGDVTQYTDELAQDAVGGMVDASLTYVDGTPLLQRAALTGDVTATAGSNATLIATPASATIAVDDKVLIKDTSASDVMKYILTQAIRDLAPGTGTMTSAQLRTALTDETGTGAAFFAGGAAGAFTATSINFGTDTLSTYDEGDWTPIPQGEATPGSPTGVFDGGYIKIGRMALVYGRCIFTGLDTMAGNFNIGGLPFTVFNASKKRAVFGVGFRGNFTNDFVITGYATENTTLIRLYNAGLDNTRVVVGDLSATTNIYFSAFFETAT